MLRQLYLKLHGNNDERIKKNSMIVVGFGRVLRQLYHKLHGNNDEKLKDYKSQIPTSL